jgi:hypothetical protein
MKMGPGAGVVVRIGGKHEACKSGGGGCRARGANALAGCKADDQRGKWVSCAQQSVKADKKGQEGTKNEERVVKLKG